MFLFHTAHSVALDAILNASELAGASVCATVTDPDGNVLYSRNGSLKVSPASNEKLFSAAFALYELGLDYKPTTRFWKQADRVVVESEGDPTLSHGDLAKAAIALGSPSLPVYVKQAYNPEIPDDWEYGDLPNRYAAPVAAFSVDQSGFDLWNNNGKLELRPESYGVRILRTKKPGKPSFSYDPIKRVVTARGTFPKKVVLLDTLAVPNAVDASSSLIGRKWTAIDQTPTDPPSYEIQGEPLSQVLAKCLQHSDNNMAENLLLMGGSHVKPLDVENPYPDALQALTDFETRTVGLNGMDLSPQDGSGLTRDNFVTTNAVVSLLNWSAKQPTGEVWKKCLAAPGLGTLYRRLKGVTFQGKTGSLSHVTALSGYLVTSESKNLTVSVILNNFTCSEDSARGVIDKFIRFIFEKGL